MNEAVIKWKINTLYKVVSQMKAANNRINDLASGIQNLKEVFADNIKINDEIAFKEYTDNCLNKTKNVSSQITGKTIPSLHSSINLLKKKLEG